MAVTKGKVVSLTYTLRDERGEIFEHTDVPISYLHGSGEGLFEKIENALDGLEVGGSVDIELAPAEGFGDHDPALTFTDDIANVPPEYQHVGAEVEAENEQGEAVRFVVTTIADGKLTVDANHPLAGQTVRFAVTVQAIRDATPEEQRLGQVTPPLH